MSRATKRAKRYIQRKHNAKAVIIMVLEKVSDTMQCNVTFTGNDASIAWLNTEGTKILKAEIGEERFQELTEMLPA